MKFYSLYLNDREEACGSGKGKHMPQENKQWEWIDENGRSWSADKIEHTFDKYIKKVMIRLVKDVVNQYIRNIAHFPIQPDDILNGVASVEMKTTAEMIEVRLDKRSLFLEDERLAGALARLKLREKKLIEYDYVLGATEEDISEYLNIARGSVFTYRYRVLRKLEKLMEAEDEKR